MDNIFITAVPSQSIRAPLTHEQRVMIAYLGSQQDLLMLDTSKSMPYSKIRWGKELALRDAWRESLRTIFARVDRGQTSFDEGLRELDTLAKRLLPEGMLEKGVYRHHVGEHFNDICKLLTRYPNLCHPTLCERMFPQDKAENFILNIVASLRHHPKHPQIISPREVRRIWGRDEGRKRFALHYVDKANQAYGDVCRRIWAVGGHFRIDYYFSRREGDYELISRTQEIGLHSSCIFRLHEERFEKGVFTCDPEGNPLFTKF